MSKFIITTWLVHRYHLPIQNDVRSWDFQCPPKSDLYVGRHFWWINSRWSTENFDEFHTQIRCFFSEEAMTGVGIHSSSVASRKSTLFLWVPPLESSGKPWLSVSLSPGMLENFLTSDSWLSMGLRFEEIRESPRFHGPKGIPKIQLKWFLFSWDFWRPKEF